jgi:hypothetical protein
MFRSSPDVEHTESNRAATAVAAQADPSELIPLSVLALDHPEPPEGWSSFLGRRGITFRPDHIGRDAISSHDAQVLLHEQRANELRAAKLRQLAEAEAVEQDQIRRAAIWTGISAADLPPGVAPAAVMLQLDKDSQPRRTTPLEEALSNSAALTYRALQDEAS